MENKIENYKVLNISYEQTKPFILKIHYAKRMPSITYSFGLYFKNELVGVVTYGSPPSQSLCKGIAGDKYKNIVLELNRLVLKNNIKKYTIYKYPKTQNKNYDTKTNIQTQGLLI